MKHVKLNISISAANLAGHCEPSLFDQFSAIPIECKTECPPRSNQVKIEKLPGDAESDSELGMNDFTFQQSHPSMSSSESSSSGVDTAIDQTVNMAMLNGDDSSASNCEIQFEDVSFADMIEADQHYGDYDLFSSFMSDLQSTADEKQNQGNDGVDSYPNRVQGDSLSSPWDNNIYASNSTIEFASNKESVKLVTAEPDSDRANHLDRKKSLTETPQRPSTYTLRPKAAASKTTSATSFEQSCLMSNHKKYGTVQQSSGDIKISRSAQQARINRQRKKAYIHGLESKMADIHKENTRLKSETLHLRRDKRSLEDEVLYLKSVLANDSVLANLLRNIDSDGVTLSKSFVNQRKRSLALDHDYGMPEPKYQRNKSMNDMHVKQATGGVCLHVDTGRVSLEFCSKCAHLASNVTDDEG